MNLTLNRRLVFLIIAIVCFAIYALFGFAVITGQHPTGRLGIGLASFAAAFV